MMNESRPKDHPATIKDILRYVNSFPLQPFTRSERASLACGHDNLQNCQEMIGNRAAKRQPWSTALMCPLTPNTALRGVRWGRAQVTLRPARILGRARSVARRD